MKKAGKVILILVLVIMFIVFGITYLFKPFKISGGDVGPYKNGQTVLSHTKINPIKLNDVVVFTRSDASIDWIGYVVGLYGDSITDAYFLPNKLFDGASVPVGFYAVKFGEGKHTWLIPQESVNYVVWYAFK